MVIRRRDRTGGPRKNKDLNLQAILYMSWSTLGLSSFPLAVAYLGDDVTAVGFQVYVGVAIAAVHFSYTIVKFPEITQKRVAYWNACKLLVSYNGVLAVAAGLNVFLFVAATRFLDTTLVTIIYGAWLIPFVMLRQRHDKSDLRRYFSISSQNWLLMFTALAGITFVLLAQTDHIGVGHDWYRTAVGLVLTLISAGLTSACSYRFKIGTLLYSGTLGGRRCSDHGLRERKRELFYVLTLNVVSDLAAVVVIVLVGGSSWMLYGLNHATMPFSSFGILLALGLIAGLCSIASRYANLVTTNLGVNTIQYLRPSLSLVWLGFFATVNVVRTDWLIIGAAAAVTSNILINFRSYGNATTHVPTTKPRTNQHL